MTSAISHPVLHDGFALGQLCWTRGVNDLVVTGEVNPIALLARYVAGDWGDLCEEDKRANDRALKGGDRILASYAINPTLKVWIITEWDRSVTTLLLPSEY